MRTLISLVIFLAIFLAGTSGWSATGNEKTSENTQKIQIEIRNLEAKLMEHPLDAARQLLSAIRPFLDGVYPSLHGREFNMNKTGTCNS